MEDNEIWKLTPLEWLTIWQTLPEMVNAYYEGVATMDVIFDEDDNAKLISLTDQYDRLQIENDALGVELHWDLRRLPAQGDFTLRTLAVMLDTVVVLQGIDDKYDNVCDIHAHLAGVGAKAVIQALAGAEIITE
jgi:hypothetical protein